MNSYERNKIKIRNRLEKYAQKVFKRALKKQTAEVLKHLNTISINTFIDSIQEIINEDEIRKAFEMTYGAAGKKIGMYVRERAIKKKDAEQEFFEKNLYKNKFETENQEYERKQTANNIAGITTTTGKRIAAASKKALEEGFKNGLGTDDIKKLIVKYSDNAATNARAKAIAQTEMVAASNHASYVAAESTGMRYRKTWSTSGLANTRESHLRAEADSINGINPNEKFSNGLMYPGDKMNGTAEEVINCRCTLLEVF